MKLATFDIFDTCLIRKCGRPEVVPYLVALKLWPDDEMRRQEYVIARKQAAQKAGLNPTIKDLYSQEVLSCFSGYSPEDLMQAEMDMESEMLVPNSAPIPIKKLPKPIRKVIPNIFTNYSTLRGDRGANLSNSITLPTLISLLQKEGWTIKFLSDMYLPSDFLECILIREGFISPLPNGGGEGGEAVIVSCEWGERKDTGRLYKKVRDRFHPEKWIHFGDNYWSDYKQAKKNGVTAYRVDSSFTPIEKKVSSLAYNSRNQYKTKLLAGIMRYARLTSPSHYGEEIGVRLEDLEGAVSLAADYIASLYIPYVAYVLNQAKKNNIKRLYFLSRDGYIMHEIAKALEPENIELKYLFVSRKSLLSSYISSAENPKEAFLKITDRQHLIGRKVDFLLSQLQIDSREIIDRFGITFNFTKILNKKQQEDFLDKIFGAEEEERGELGGVWGSMEERGELRGAWGNMGERGEHGGVWGSMEDHGEHGEERDLKERFREEFRKGLKKKGDLVLEYLKQEGLTASPLGGDLEGAAMVDIGWLGTTRMMVNGILSPRPPKGENLELGELEKLGEAPLFLPERETLEVGGISTFYLGVRGDVYSAKYGPFDSYFPLGVLSTDATGLIENYYSASPWPSTIGYAPHPNPPLSGREADYPHGGGGKEGVTPMFKDGEEYKMTPIIETNVKIGVNIAKELKPYLGYLDDEILFQWAKITVDSLSTMEFPVDLSPMADSTEFDGIPMVKKLTIVELVNIIFFGGRVTAFDRGSLSYTLGHKLSQSLWKIHEITGRLRSFLYRVQLRLKK